MGQRGWNASEAGAIKGCYIVFLRLTLGCCLGHSLTLLILQQFTLLNMLVAVILFWLCVALVFHTYVLFPWLLGIFSKGKKLNTVVYKDGDEWPMVHVVISVYNSAHRIHTSLQSIIGSDYPKDRLRIWIGSDGSTDDTNALLHDYRSRYGFIHFYPFESRRGKGPVINELVAEVSKHHHDPDDILLLTDSGATFTANTISGQVKHYKNPAIGLVGCNIISSLVREDGVSLQEERFSEREMVMKYQEGITWGTSMGAFGSCYTIRRRLYHPVPQFFLVDDFYISMRIMLEGYHAIYDLEAKCIRDVSNDAKTEYRRKVRMGAGNFQNMFRFASLLWKPNALSFCFWSHKGLRWLTPFFLLISITAAGLLALQHTFYLWVFALQCLALISPFVNAWFLKMQIHNRLLRFVAHFYLMNAGIFMGFVKFAKGVKENTWQPTPRK